MKILIDIGHPGHVHLFRPFAKLMLEKGHSALFTCRQKEFEIELLESSGFNYVSFGRHFKSKIGKIWGLFKFNWQMLLTAFKFKPDVFLSHGSPYAAQVAWLIRKPHISFEDTFNFEQVRLYKPFTRVILTSDYPHPYLGANNTRYKGYHELAYLHPNQFLPDKSVVQELGLQPGEAYVILRFVSWNATHDVGHTGMSLENKFKVVQALEKHARVFISSEKELPPGLDTYKFPLPPHRMHHAIAFSSLVFGESATMAAEGAVLGVPGVYLDNTGRYYTRELEEKYGLVFNFTESLEDQDKAILKGIEILESDNQEEWKLKRERMLADKIDVTAFLVWFIENYPASKKTMQENPAYQNRFK